jgi:3D (Asp-Asp-Asp) domain-containing protein
MVMGLALLVSWPSLWSLMGPSCTPRTMRVTFYTCAEGFSHCLTKKGNQPIPFRTVAVGDRALLGRWLYVEDLGGWVHASDTGHALGRNGLDVFIGEARMVRHARRLGVQFWTVSLCPPQHQPVVKQTAAFTLGDDVSTKSESGPTAHVP